LPGWIGLVPEDENLVAASANRLGGPDPCTIEKIHVDAPIGRADDQFASSDSDEATEGLAPLVQQEI
jgi:hypothetical protein